MKLGEALKMGRKAKGLTLRELSLITGIGHSEIHRIETGHNRNVGFPRVVKLAKALDWT